VQKIWKYIVLMIGAVKQSEMHKAMYFILKDVCSMRHIHGVKVLKFIGVLSVEEKDSLMSDFLVE